LIVGGFSSGVLIVYVLAWHEQLIDQKSRSLKKISPIFGAQVSWYCSTIFGKEVNRSANILLHTTAPPFTLMQAISAAKRILTFLILLKRHSSSAQRFYWVEIAIGKVYIAIWEQSRWEVLFLLAGD